MASFRVLFPVCLEQLTKAKGSLGRDGMRADRETGGSRHDGLHCQLEPTQPRAVLRKGALCFLGWAIFRRSE